MNHESPTCVNHHSDRWRTVEDRLRERFGERFSTATDERERHCSQARWLPRERPDGVVSVRTEAEMVDVVDLCRSFAVPLIPFGAGTSIEGQVNAPYGGLALDTGLMNAVVDARWDDDLVRVQPGITREALNAYLLPHHRFFPVDPGANATIGGMASTRASGTHAVRYGTIKDNVQCARVILPSGHVAALGTDAAKSAAGYDLLPLFIGAEGTLGVFSEITVRVQPIPNFVAAGVASFATVAAAVRCVGAAMRAVNCIKRIELLDDVSIRAANEYSGLSLRERPHVFFEFDGQTEDELKSAVDRVSEILSNLVDVESDFAFTDDGRADLWRARHETWWATQAQFPGRVGIPTDVCVPRSVLAECVDSALELAAGLGLDAPLCGHVGDGNFHTMVLIEETPANIAKAQDYVTQLARTALALGGTVTGEHGIGQGKRDLLMEETPSGVDLMKVIKQSLDPTNFMNPGKIF